MKARGEEKESRLDWLPVWLVSLISKIRGETTQALREKPEEGIFRGKDFVVNSSGNQMHLILYIDSNSGIEITHINLKPNNEALRACREFVLFTTRSNQRNIKYEVIRSGNKETLKGEAFVVLIPSKEEIVLRDGNRITNLPQASNPNLKTEGFLKIKKLDLAVSSV